VSQAQNHLPVLSLRVLKYSTGLVALVHCKGHYSESERTIV